MPAPSIQPRPARYLMATLALVAAAGCASPGPPRPPSLHMPAPVTDLAAERIGDSVELRLTVPNRSSDKLPLPQKVLLGALCRSLDAAACMPVASFSAEVKGTGPGGRTIFRYRDILPAALASGSPHLLGYRVEFFSPHSQSAGASAAAYAASGATPPLVEGLHVAGARSGALLTWVAAPLQSGDVVLEREDLSAASQPAATVNETKSKGRRAKSNVVMLASNSAETSTLDTTLKPDTPYRYHALRVRKVQLGGHALELRSELSTPADLTLRQVYPPATPTGLTLAAFGEGAGFAVDLIWQPVDDSAASNGPAPPLAGYNIYREAAGGQRQRLNTAPVRLPAFHDATAEAAVRYVYSVTAVDAKGNESSSARSSE